MITAVTSTSFVEVTPAVAAATFGLELICGKGNTGVAYFSDDPDHATQCEIRADLPGGLYFPGEFFAAWRNRLWVKVASGDVVYARCYGEVPLEQVDLVESAGYVSDR